VRSKHYDDIAIHMLENHGIDLLDSEISDIIHVCAPALQAMQGEAAPQPAVPDGLHQMIVDYIRDDFETLQDGGDWCVITPEDVEEQLKYLRKHDLLIQHPTDPERVMVALLSAGKGEAPQPAVPDGYQIQKQGNVIVIDHTDEQKGGVAIFKSEKTVRMQFLYQYFDGLLSAGKGE
jgi:hypothetical protein